MPGFADGACDRGERHLLDEHSTSASNRGLTSLASRGEGTNAALMETLPMFRDVSVTMGAMPPDADAFSGQRGGLNGGARGRRQKRLGRRRP